jgi:hypothetical protein
MHAFTYVNVVTVTVTLNELNSVSVARAQRKHLKTHHLLLEFSKEKSAADKKSCSIYTLLLPNS